MKKLAILSSAACLLLFLGACKKKTETEDAQPAKFKTNLERILGSWIEVDRVNLTGSIWKDVDDCEKDDLTVFRADSGYEYNAGPTKCDPSDPQVRQGPGQWIFTKEEKYINLGGLEFKIETLTDTRMTLVLSGSGYYLASYYEKR